MTKQQLKELLKDMSLQEKVNQMLQVAGNFYMDDTVITGPMKESGFTEENISQAGSVLGVLGASKIKEIQKSYMEKHPHKIPLLFMLDIINGFRTVFPIPLGQGATFEPELSEKLAAAAAKEAAVSGLHVTFAPMVDLVRDARWGRVMESTGEDTYLNCLFSEAMVRGFQGDDLNAPYNIAACVKHFAGYGAPTAGRDYNTVELSEHTLREFYLPSYKAGIDAGAALVMTSFNTIDGVPATGNKRLMRQILREEMGFDGVLISDWAAIEEIIYHGYCEDRKEESLVRYAEYLLNMLQYDIFSVPERRTYLERLEGAFNRLEEKESSLITGTMLARAMTLWSKLGEQGKEELLVQTAEKYALKDLEALKICLKYYMKKGEREKFFALLEEVKKSSLTLDGEVLEWLRFYEHK